MPAAIVTGANGGVGTAVCRSLEDRGYRVLGVDRMETYGAADGEFAFDLRDLSEAPERTEPALAKIEASLEGELNLLVNNAAVQITKPIEAMTLDDWMETLRVNLLAPAACVPSIHPGFF